MALRPLEALYPVVYLDCIYVKLRVDGSVRTQAVYVAIAINLDGVKEVLGLWIGTDATEGSRFWLSVLTELQHRGLEDVFIFCVDGLKGFPERSPQQGVSCRYLQTVLLAMTRCYLLLKALRNRASLSKLTSSTLHRSPDQKQHDLCTLGST